MSDPFFEIQQEHVFTLRMDIAGLAALEKGMAFYSERAILQDGDPARDLARTLTSMLMKLAITRNAVETPETAILPPDKGDAPEVADPAADVEAELRRRLEAHERNGPEAVVADHPNAHRAEPTGFVEDDAMTEEKIQEAVEQFVTEETDEAVEDSQTVGDPDDPLAQQLDAMIGD